MARLYYDCQRNGFFGPQAAAAGDVVKSYEFIPNDNDDDDISVTDDDISCTNSVDGKSDRRTRGTCGDRSLSEVEITNGLESDPPLYRLEEDAPHLGWLSGDKSLRAKFTRMNKVVVVDDLSKDLPMPFAFCNACGVVIGYNKKTPFRKRLKFHMKNSCATAAADLEQMDEPNDEEPPLKRRRHSTPSSSSSSSSSVAEGDVNSENSSNDKKSRRSRKRAYIVCDATEAEVTRGFESDPPLYKLADEPPHTNWLRNYKVLRVNFTRITDTAENEPIPFVTCNLCGMVIHYSRRPVYMTAHWKEFHTEKKKSREAEATEGIGDNVADMPHDEKGVRLKRRPPCSDSPSRSSSSDNGADEFDAANPVDADTTEHILRKEVKYTCKFPMKNEGARSREYCRMHGKRFRGYEKHFNANGERIPAVKSGETESETIDKIRELHDAYPKRPAGWIAEQLCMPRFDVLYYIKNFNLENRPNKVLVKEKGWSAADSRDRSSNRFLSGLMNPTADDGADPDADSNTSVVPVKNFSDADKALFSTPVEELTREELVRREDLKRAKLPKQPASSRYSARDTFAAICERGRLPYVCHMLQYILDNETNGHWLTDAQMAWRAQVHERTLRDIKRICFETPNVSWQSPEFELKVKAIVNENDGMKKFADERRRRRKKSDQPPEEKATWKRTYEEKAEIAAGLVSVPPRYRLEVKKHRANLAPLWTGYFRIKEIFDVDDPTKDELIPFARCKYCGIIQPYGPLNTAGLRGHNEIHVTRGFS